MNQQFSAKIYKLGINPCVDVPKRMSEAFKRTGYVPVAGTLNGQRIRATLVPKGNGRHRLYLNGEMRRRAQVDVGDRVKLVLDIDRRSRTTPMPKDFAMALKKNPEARSAFKSLRPSRRKEILVYLKFLKRPESLRRNIDRVIAGLTKPRSHSTLHGIQLD